MNETAQHHELPELTRALVSGDEMLLQNFLADKKHSSLFLLSNLARAGVAYHGRAFEGNYVAALQGQQIAAVAAHYWNGNLILQAPTSVREVVQGCLAASARDLKGIIGTSEQVTTALAALSIDREQCSLYEKEGLYVLDLAKLIVPEALGNGTLTARYAEPRDVPLLTDWYVAYGVETLGEVDSPELRDEKRTGVERKLAAHECWVLFEGKTPVASTQFNATADDLVQVGGVWTPPEFRGRGYARAAVAASLIDARTAGATQAVLFTGDENVPAQKAYKALGFGLIGTYMIAFLKNPLASIDALQRLA